MDGSRDKLIQLWGSESYPWLPGTYPWLNLGPTVWTERTRPSDSIWTERTEPTATAWQERNQVLLWSPLVYPWAADFFPWLVEGITTPTWSTRTKPTTTFTNRTKPTTTWSRD